MLARRQIRHFLAWGVLFIIGSAGISSDADPIGCPLPNSAYHWPVGTSDQPTIVWYGFDDNMDSGQRAQIQVAINIWNNANNSNGSHVQFLLVPPEITPYIVFRNTESQVPCTLGGGFPGNGQTGQLTLSPNRLIIEFYQNSFCGGQPLYDPGRSYYNTIYTKVALHELGHTLGLKDIECAFLLYGSSVMDKIPCQPPDTNDWQFVQSPSPSSCDNACIDAAYNPGTGGGGPGNGGSCPKPQIAGQESMSVTPEVCGGSPIIIDLSGNGFHLTDAAEGVLFDLHATGTPERIAWTRSGSDDAWLALDRNGNGLIDDGSELFGNYTEQPGSDFPNGFLALAEFDKPENGGNGDGIINRQDAIFASLRLWQDRNHNGISEPTELMSLESIGIRAIELTYHDSRRVDDYGNVFRYRGRIRTERSSDVERVIFDVFLVAQ